MTYLPFDGLNIESSLYKAHAENINGHMIIWPHGGPQSAETHSFRASFSILLTADTAYFTFQRFIRYGLSFMKMVEGEWEMGPVMIWSQQSTG